MTNKKIIKDFEKQMVLLEPHENYWIVRNLMQLGFERGGIVDTLVREYTLKLNASLQQAEQEVRKEMIGKILFKLRLIIPDEFTGNIKEAKKLQKLKEQMIESILSNLEGKKVVNK